MPNRIIKESICTSESVDSLSWFEESFFYRLIVNCDDYGRMDARSAILKSRLFPLKEGITLKQIEAALSKLLTAGMVQVYMYDQKPYLQLVSWGKHQSVRNKRSKYPEPPALESNCVQMQADVPVIQSNPNPYPNLEAEPAHTRDESATGGLADVQISDLRRIGEAYENDLGAIPSSAMHEFREYYLIAGLSADVIIKAIQSAAENNVRTWPYAKAILERCVTEKVITLDDWKQAELRKQSRKQQRQGKSNTIPGNSSYDIVEIEEMINKGVF